MIIKVKSTPQIRRVVPGYVFQQQPFKFSPLGFSIDVNDNSQELVYTKQIQLSAVENFIKSPFGGQNFIITGYLDDSKALYLAAYLVQAHIIAKGSNPVWVTLNSSYKEALETITKPSLIVVSNITKESLPVRFEKCRDLVYKYWDVPKIIVGCGLDPIRFGGLKLHIPVNKMVYFKSGLDAETAVVE